MAGNRIVLVSFPTLASVIAVTAGIGSVFVIVGLILAAAGTMVQIHSRRLSRGRNP
jgi:hypothetical protein